MHNRFARTSNVENFYSAFHRLEQRGSREASWLMVLGVPGLGKTKMVHHFAIETGAVYVRAKANWSATWMLQEIAGCLGLDAEGSKKAIFARVIAALVESGVAVVVDEARNMLHDERLLETLRDISDTTDATVILSGEEFVLGRLSARYPQIRSRITETVKFSPATFEDVRICCDTICELPVADDLVAEILRQSKGYLREIKNAIAMVERLGIRDGWSPIEKRHVANLQLCQDRNEARAPASKTEPKAA